MTTYRHFCPDCGGDNIDATFELPINKAAEKIQSGLFLVDSLWCNDCGDNIGETEWKEVPHVPEQAPLVEQS